jgi:hypothetical protein
MALTMRPTALSSPVDQDRQDFTVYCGKWALGRIYQERGGEAKVQFESAWKQWLTWAKADRR